MDRFAGYLPMDCFAGLLSAQKCARGINLRVCLKARKLRGERKEFNSSETVDGEIGSPKSRNSTFFDNTTTCKYPNIATTSTLEGECSSWGRSDRGTLKRKDGAFAKDEDLETVLGGIVADVESVWVPSKRGAGAVNGSGMSTSDDPTNRCCPFIIIISAASILLTIFIRLHIMVSFPTLWMLSFPVVVVPDVVVS